MKVHEEDIRFSISPDEDGEIEKRISSSCTFIRNEGPPNKATTCAGWHTTDWGMGKSYSRVWEGWLAIHSLRQPAWSVKQRLDQLHMSNGDREILCVKLGFDAS
ncbi:unnamed protein product [Protopolystoma xenopodis]|uniref:Uncharacterized protein n=1 Tax=Protopolystoma xenopodis TaxID=117903 RepID=A0A448WT24_9PLAT|nr:unnamed protein product [Protopolystoma xenopodis]